MAREQYANNPSSQLDGAINNSVTSLTVDDASGFPTANFRLICESEVMICTSRSSNTLTVVRGQESTAAASHADNTAVRCIITKGALDAVKLDVLYNALVPRTTALSADDDEFNDDSFSGWTRVHSGSTPTVTEVEQDHGLSIHCAAGGAAGQWTGYMKSKSPSAGDWVSIGYNSFGMGGGYPHCSLVFADGTTYGAGNQVLFGVSPNENAFVLRSTTNYNNQTAFNSAGVANRLAMGLCHQKMVYQGSNTWDCYVSPDGIQWGLCLSSTSMGSLTPTKMGFAITSWAGNQHVWNVKYVRFSF